MRAIWLLPFLIFTFVFANDLNTTKPIANESIILLTYEKKPDRVYVGQIFKIKLKAVIATNDFDKITTDFEDAIDTKVLNPENSWKWYNDNIYYIEYYLKVTSSDAKLPNIVVKVLKKDKLVASSNLKAFAPEIIKLKKSANFSGVIAKNLKILKSKTTKFDKKSNILVLEIEGKEANLRDFSVDNCIKNGVDSYNLNLPFIKIFYFVILPNTQDSFKFSYFDLSKGKFENKIIPIEVSSEDISTQLELNPKDSKISLYKNVILVIVAFIALVIFFFRRKIVYIAIFILILIYLSVFYNPFDSIVIPQKTKIRILPTYNSTIFYVTDRKIVAQKLNTTKNYIKILLPNGKIGWIQKGLER